MAILLELGAFRVVFRVADWDLLETGVPLKESSLSCWTQERRYHPFGRNVAPLRSRVCWNQERGPRHALKMLDRLCWNQERD